MKKVTAFIASQQKRATYGAVREFEAQLRSRAELEFEYVFLKDYHLENCRGCTMCFIKGEGNCPFKDDRDVLLRKMSDSDGIIFATPNYAFGVAAPMKTLIDRLAFILHRPRFFGKTFTTIVTQGMFGGGAIVKYLDGKVAKGLGFSVAKGCTIRALGERDEADLKKNTQKIKKAADRFYRKLMRKAPSSPSLFRLMLFRMSRTSIKGMLDDTFCDFRHYKEHGWFEDEYYYPVSLGLLKKTAGSLFDVIGRRLAKQR
jgi:multimeric flavodoxin WrbA